MQFLPQILFIILSGVAIFLFAKKASEIRRNILLGKDEDFSDNKNLRWKNLIFLALGQKKMFKNPLVAIMHLVVYVGFIIINIEVLEIVLDGLFNQHRLFAGLIPVGLYSFLINVFEVLAVGVTLACIIFLVRRNVIKL
ncbi:MAG: Fe-S oxidoreductase, partial [Chitinophagaceae bacterium]|nr:Fe-S oxidoreductase [Chitinophagaceae bacterium]